MSDRRSDVSAPRVAEPYDVEVDEKVLQLHLDAAVLDQAADILTRHNCHITEQGCRDTADWLRRGKPEEGGVA